MPLVKVTVVAPFASFKSFSSDFEIEVTQHELEQIEECISFSDLNEDLQEKLSDSFFGKVDLDYDYELDTSNDYGDWSCELNEVLEHE